MKAGALALVVSVLVALPGTAAAQTDPATIAESLKSDPVYSSPGPTPASHRPKPGGFGSG
jgi:hypothetical protein